MTRTNSFSFQTEQHLLFLRLFPLAIKSARAACLWYSRRREIMEEYTILRGRVCWFVDSLENCRLVDGTLSLCGRSSYLSILVTPQFLLTCFSEDWTKYIIMYNGLIGHSMMMPYSWQKQVSKAEDTVNCLKFKPFLPNMSHYGQQYLEDYRHDR